MVEADFEFQAFADDGHEHIDRHSDPDLRLHGVLAGTVECLDSEVLLDPLEEQFYLPSRFVDLRNGECRKRKVVGEKLEPLSCLNVEIGHETQCVWVRFYRVYSGQDDSVIGSNPGCLIQGCE